MFPSHAALGAGYWVLELECSVEGPLLVIGRVELMNAEGNSGETSD